MKLIAIGNIAYDTTLLMTDYPRENTKQYIRSMVQNGGGSAANMACVLGSFGEDITMIGTVGDDYAGKHIKQEFLAHHVNIDFIETNSDCITPVSHILVNEATGTRTILSFPKEKTLVGTCALAFEPDAIIMDGSQTELAHALLKKYPNALSIINLDKMKKEMIDLAREATYVVCSKMLAEQLSGQTFNLEDETSIETVFSHLKNQFLGYIIVTLGEQGCFYWNQETIQYQEAIKVKEIDTTGAGDIFTGAFLYALLHQFSDLESLKIATCAGALAVTRLGSRLGIPSISEMKELYHEFR